ncbi:unnamed protein product [Durusdinium trenchii]|uniref:Uncharacterized protein n=1 Tax=Durusdinium trenchii TaxID=1381693 RepID=A0ABP0HJI9_9DINO
MKPSCPSAVEAYAAPVNGSRASAAQAFSSRLQLQEDQGAQALSLALPAPKSRGEGPSLRPSGSLPKPPKQQVEALAKNLALAARQRPERKDPTEAPILALAPPPPPSKGRVSTGSGRGRPHTGSVLSHATTPSWRSRSKQVSQPLEGREDVADGKADLPRRRSPLLEKRWTAVENQRMAPRSELDRLEHIDPDVDEANAMLVESFLNVKRSLGAEMNEATSQCSQTIPSASSYFISKPHGTTPRAGQGNQGGLQQAGYQVLTSLPVPPLSARNTSALGSAYSCATDLSSSVPVR